MSGIFNFFTALLKKISDFAAWIISIFKQIFADLWNVVTDLFCWLFESLLHIATGALDAIDTPFNPQTYYAMIPSEAASLMGYIGAPQAISIVVAALVIRFTLQTIPFVRWGS